MVRHAVPGHAVRLSSCLTARRIHEIERSGTRGQDHDQPIADAIDRQLRSDHDDGEDDDGSLGA